MPNAYSVDLRSRVFADFDAGIDPTALARRYRVARSWVYKLIGQRSELGYSPDFNPIEQVFAKLKALLRKARARPLHALWNRLGELSNEFSQTECQNYFRHSGYPSSQT